MIDQHTTTADTEEHELPCIEAVLAGTLALMTGYSQALQAAAHPQQRLLMGHKIASQLELLADHGQLSSGFCDVLAGLSRRWRSMTACTEAAARDCLQAPCGGSHCFDAPRRLQ